MRDYENEMMTNETKDDIRSQIKEEYGIYVLKENGIEKEITAELKIKMPDGYIKSPKIKDVVEAIKISYKNGGTGSFIEVIEFIKEKIKSVNTDDELKC